MEILIPLIIVGSIGAFLGLGLGIASKKLFVHVDPRIPMILDVLPNANCGACGYAGCSGFAKAVAEGKAAPNGCIPRSKCAHAMNLLGVTASAEPQIAVVHCKNGRKEAAERAIYNGIQDCGGNNNR